MAAPELLARLNQLATEIGALHSKLILLVGGPHTGKTVLLAAFARQMDASTLNVGSELGRRLAAIPQVLRETLAGLVPPRVAYDLGTAIAHLALDRALASTQRPPRRTDARRTRRS